VHSRLLFGLPQKLPAFDPHECVMPLEVTSYNGRITRWLVALVGSAVVTILRQSLRRNWDKWTSPEIKIGARLQKTKIRLISAKYYMIESTGRQK
jgi:hypothetical protein